jgi:hypothetical protein
MSLLAKNLKDKIPSFWGRVCHRVQHWLGTNPSDCEYRSGVDGKVYWYLWCTVCEEGKPPPREGCDGCDC